MKHQTDLQLIGYIGKYGCFFMTIAYWFNLVVNKIEVGHNLLNSWWMRGITEKDENGGTIISGDVNGDGDMDDPDELLIVNKNALCKIAGLSLIYVGSFEPDKAPKGIDYFYIGEFYREWTEKKELKSFTHFAGIDNTFKCVYDPIKNGSLTVKLGKLKTVRVFQKVAV